MFWQSIPKAFVLFSHPTVAMTLGSYLLLSVGFSYLIGVFTQNPQSQTGAGPGCLVQVLGLLLQALLIAPVILFLLPLLLGALPQSHWSLVEPLSFVALRAGILAVCVVMFLSWSPWIGPFLSKNPGLETFLLATLTFRWLAPSWSFSSDPLAASPLKFPNLWESLAYFVFAFLLGKIFLLVLWGLERGYRITLLRQTTNPNLWIKRWADFLEMLAGMLAFLMYASYGV